MFSELLKARRHTESSEYVQIMYLGKLKLRIVSVVHHGLL